MLPTDVSPRRRVLQVAASVVFCFLTVGLVFGYAALKPVLLASGVYAELCEPDKPGCAAQDTKLNFLFILATSTVNMASFPVGVFLDSVGPQVSTLTGAVVFAAGCVVFSLGHVGKYVDTYLLGYFLLALGAPAIFLAQFHLSNTFPARSGLILGAITGAFDASSFPLVFYKAAFFAFGERPSLRTFFSLYTAIPILLVVQQLSFGPWESYERPGEVEAVEEATDALIFSSPFNGPSTLPPQPTRRSISPGSPYSPATSPDRSANANRRTSAWSTWSRDEEGNPTHRRRRPSVTAYSRVAYDIPDNADESEQITRLEQGCEMRDPVVGVLFGQSAVSQVYSSWFWIMEFMVAVHMTRINWYLATVQSQLTYYTKNPGLASTLTDTFTILLPLAGIVTVPAVGWLLDTRRIRDVALVMLSFGVGFGGLGLASHTVPQLIGIALLVCFRPLFYTAISDYAAKVFGFETFGTVYGWAMTLSGLLGLVLSPMDKSVKEVFHGSYTVYNVLLLVLGVISSGLLAWRTSVVPTRGAIALPPDVVIEEVVEEEEP
ncbi:hypothetical protein Q8F55_005913 [Vanrija albida]|uniref:Major facilitator superfamily (MFS) profile domain-containing protein n=1 Tax=Vanrija albida TaxID=181172 RepID=A0ABR3Q2X2_9TREE